MNRSATYITTLSGRQLHIFNPAPDQFDHEDLATGLSNECRWGGQMKRFYSVAQHALYVGLHAQALATQAGLGSEVSRGIGLLGHLHDAAEGLGLRDMPTPIKRFLPEYVAAEHELLMCVLCKYAGHLFDSDLFRAKAAVVSGRGYMEPVLHPFVGDADAVLLATEHRDLITHRVEGSWKPAAKPLSMTIRPVEPKEAKAAWLKRFDELTEGKFTQ